MKHFLNGIEVAPRNLLTIGVKTDFSDRPEYLEVDADRVILPREAVPIIQQHLQQYGPFEGIPYTMVLENGETLEYYVDLQEDALYRTYDIEVKIKKRGGADNFWDNADGLSFELMAKKGVAFQYIDVPYVINPADPVPTLITLAVGTYTMTYSLIQQIRAVSEAITNVIDALPPVPANLGQLATLVIKALVEVAILAATLVALIKMLQQLKELIYPKIRYYKGHEIKKLIELGCQYLGYTFNSTILEQATQYAGLLFLGVPLSKEKNGIFDFIANDLNFSFTKGHPTAQDTTPTLGSLIRAMEDMFNAKTRVRNGNVRLERWDYWQDLSNQGVLPALNIQNDRQEQYRLNTADIWKRTYIHYQVDYTELTSVDFFDPTDAEYSTEPIAVGNADLLSIKGLVDVNIPFALATRKNKLNLVEKTFKLFLSTADFIINAFGGNGNLAAQVQDRLGVMALSQQYYATSKIMLVKLSTGKQAANYVSKLKASTIYNQYHSINQIVQNDWKIYEDVPVRMSAQEFVSLLNNNYAEINGVVCEILSIQFKDERSLATITYREPFDWANGKVFTLAINE
jgi:hypothetical protein